MTDWKGHQKAPDLELPEFGGAWEVTFTDANHAHVGSPNGWAGENKGIITIRGVEYGGSVHMHLWSDGKWHIGPEDKPDWHDFRKVHLSRLHDYKPVSDAATRKAGEVIEPRFNEYIAELDGVLLEQAEQKAISNELFHLERDIAKLEEELAPKRERQRELLARIK